jgi:Transposase DDE domain group 1
VRLQLHALAYNLGNFLRTLALPAGVAQWSMTTLRDRLVKIGARIVRHARSVTFQMAEVAVSRSLFQQILAAITALRPSPPARAEDQRRSRPAWMSGGDARPNDGFWSGSRTVLPIIARLQGRRHRSDRQDRCREARAMTTIRSEPAKPPAI